MLFPLVIAYELEPPGSWLGARKYHAAAATARKAIGLRRVMGVMAVLAFLLLFDTLAEKLDGISRPTKEGAPCGAPSSVREAVVA
jgi:hypothetical protein